MEQDQNFVFDLVFFKWILANISSYNVGFRLINFKFLNTTGFVDFDDYESVDLVVSQREHFIEGHRMRVELALPMVNDSLYEKDVVAPGTFT